MRAFFILKNYFVSKLPWRWIYTIVDIVIFFRPTIYTLVDITMSYLIIPKREFANIL